MRTTIACERCRNSKVKCHHTGESPCRGCARSGNPDTCILTPTIAKTLSGVHSPRVSKRKRAALFASQNVSGSAAKKLYVEPSTSISTACTSDELESHFTGIEAGIFTQAVIALRVRFPECGFLHPSDLGRVSGDLTHDEKLRLISILAVSCRYLGPAVAAQRAEHAALLTQELQLRITAPPSLSLIQCFLLMALYEWGEGIGYTAWMYAGIAARMAQVYRATKTETRGRDAAKAMASSSSVNALTEVEIRTMWTYFAIDKLLSCGKQRPAMIQAADIEVRMPQSEENFVFGSSDPRGDAPSFQDLTADSALRTRMSGPGFHFCVLVRGLDIWHKLHSWIVDGGRHMPRMTTPEQCPWKVSSQWAKLKEQLLCWRADQHARLKYPETELATHVHFSCGEVFAYTNLLYYLCIIFLCREFIPLLPIAEQEPSGPTDPPFYSEEAPPGWWRKNTNELFEAAAQISYIMRDLGDLGITLHTPFTGLCVFTAALMNRYAVTFPHMHRPEERELRRRLGAENLADLEKIAQLWPLAAEWAQVIGASQNLYDRVVRETISCCQSEYPELVNSVHYAALGTIHPDKRESHCRCPAAARQKQAHGAPSHPYTRSVKASHERGGVAEQLCEQGTSQSTMPDISTGSDAGIGTDADATGDDDWRLWSFWDDPHLLSWDASTTGI